MKTNLVYDELPSILYRTYKDEDRQYAEDLVRHGSLRLRPLSYYRATGDHREDSTEGQSYVLVPGDVPVVAVDVSTGNVEREWTQSGHFHRRSEFVNATYLCCLSAPAIDWALARRRFGRWTVAVRQPLTFLERFAAAVESLRSTDVEPTFVDAFPVAYSKGSVMQLADVQANGLRLDYGQKSSDHMLESEYRVVTVLAAARSAAPAYLEIKMGDMSDIAELIDLDSQLPSNTR